MSVKVSIVVPVYNTGPYIELCIDSILGQSLPADEYEAIFVDDGSTDDTPARLDELAAEHPNVHVIHTSNSGWAGTPRNIGIDAAVGEFIQFVDSDDYLGAEAMERMYDYGVANGADVIVGRMAGQGRMVPRDLFRANRPAIGMDGSALTWGLTPHKMFRASFLAETGLRFLEGRRRLEDHAFMMEAYLRARSIAVLSDYVCYYHTTRDDAGNNSVGTFDPVGYFGNLREAFDVLERYSEPGPRRDTLMQRWLRRDMTDRLRGRRLLVWPEDARPGLFDEIRKLAVERVTPGAVARLMPMQRIAAALYMADEFDETLGLAQWEAGVRASAFLRDLRWEDGVLHVDFDAELQVDGAPMTFRRHDGVELLDPPLAAAGRAAVAAAGIDVAAHSSSARADLTIRNRATGVELFADTTITYRYAGPDERLRFLITGAATLDPRTAMTGHQLGDGTWDVFVLINANGWAEQVRLGAARSAEATASCIGAAFDDIDRSVVPYWTQPHGNLSLRMAEPLSSRYAPHRVIAGLRRRAANMKRR
jgi:poly(ribitol-phosphate) beta-N-acetylglucosaminyltransferase